jgi:ethanolamine ammonia-lyase small subunit
MGINIDKWIGSYKIRAFDWIDSKQIYFNVQYYTPGQSIQKSPVWDKTVYITRNDVGQRLVNSFTHSLVEHIAKMQIADGAKVTITV